MSTPPVNFLTVFTSQLSTGTAAVNELATDKGSVDVTGTIVGVEQTTQSVFSLATTGSETTFATKYVPGAGHTNQMDHINNWIPCYVFRSLICLPVWAMRFFLKLRSTHPTLKIRNVFQVVCSSDHF